MGFLDTLFGGGAEKEAADKNRALYSDYLSKGTGYLDSGLASSKGYLDSAYNSLDSLGKKYGGASSLLLDSLGVNGAAGNANAVNSFQAGPGYQFTLDQGLEALNRRRASAGMLDSGNADIDALTYGTGLANQTYGDWQSKLGSFVSPELSATTGAAGVQQSLSDLYQNDAANRIGLQGNYTSGTASANNAEAAGKAAGAKNLLGGALSLATLGTSLYTGGASGLGSLLGSGGKQSSMSYGGQQWPMFT